MFSRQAARLTEPLYLGKQILGPIFSWQKATQCHQFLCYPDRNFDLWLPVASNLSLAICTSHTFTWHSNSTHYFLQTRARFSQTSLIFFLYLAIWFWFSCQLDTPTRLALLPPHPVLSYARRWCWTVLSTKSDAFWRCHNSTAQIPRCMRLTAATVQHPGCLANPAPIWTRLCQVWELLLWFANNQIVQTQSINTVFKCSVHHCKTASCLKKQSRQV